MCSVWLKSKIAIILSFWLIPTFAQGQYFNRIHTFGNNENNLLATDTGYVVLQQGNNVGNDHELELQYFDLQGQFVKMDSFDMVYFYEDCRNCLKPYKDGWLKLATVFYTGNSAGMHLTYFNKNLDTLKTWDYSYQNLRLTDAMGLVVSGNDVVLLGNHLNLSNSQFEGVAVWLDSNLNISQERLYTPQNLNEQGGYALFDGVVQKDGGHIFSGIRSYYASTSTLKNQGLLLKTDSLGQEEWRLELTGPEGNNEVLLQKLSDSTVAFVTTRIDSPDTHPYTRLRTGIINRDGIILNDTTFGPLTRNMQTQFFKTTRDGNFIVGGYAQGLGFKSYAVKFRSNGEILWFREYFNGNDIGVDQGVLESMLFTQDGGMLFGGYFLDRNGLGAHTWLVKTDSLGCDTPGCQNIGLPEQTTGRPAFFSLYPNPAETAVTLKWQARDLDLNAPLTFKILSTQGQTLQSIVVKNYQNNQQMLNLETLASGTYLLEISTQEKVLDVQRLVKR